MKRRTFVARVAASGAALARAESGLAQTDSGMATPATEASDTTPQSGSAPVHGLQMYYEIHGSRGVPVVLLHGPEGEGGRSVAHRRGTNQHDHN